MRPWPPGVVFNRDEPDVSLGPVMKHHRTKISHDRPSGCASSVDAEADLWGRSAEPLPARPRVEVDDVRQRREGFAAGQMIIARQPFRPIRIVLKLHALCAVTWKDRLLAGLARRAAAPAAIRKLVIEKHRTLRTFYRPRSSQARLPQADTRGGLPVPDNVAFHLLFRPYRLPAAYKWPSISNVYKEEH